MEVFGQSVGNLIRTVKKKQKKLADPVLSSEVFLGCI